MIHLKLNGFLPRKSKDLKIIDTLMEYPQNRGSKIGTRFMYGYLGLGSKTRNNKLART